MDPPFSVGEVTSEEAVSLDVAAVAEPEQGPGSVALALDPSDGLIRNQARLEALYRYGILDTDPEPQFDRIVRLAARHFGMPIASTTLIDADRQWFKARIGLPDTQTPLDNSICAVTIQQPGTLVIPDAQLDPRVCLYDAVTGDLMSGSTPVLR